MTDKIRDAAEKLIKEGYKHKYIYDAGSYGVNIQDTQAFQDLKAALPPSKQEVAQRLAEFNTAHTCLNPPTGGLIEVKAYLNHAIEYLRES